MFFDPAASFDFGQFVMIFKTLHGTGSFPETVIQKNLTYVAAFHIFCESFAIRLITRR